MKAEENKAIERMSMSVVVAGITFSELMVKIKHADRSWANG